MAAWATRRLAGRERTWSWVRGPATATCATLARIGWRFRDGLTLVTQRGVVLRLARDSPALVVSLAHEAVREWRWARVGRSVSSLRPQPHQPALGPCWRPLIRLMDPSVKVPGWSPELRGALRSAVCNRQWPQARKHQAGFTASPFCLLCIPGGPMGLRQEADGRPALPCIGTLWHRSVMCAAHAVARRSAPAPVRRAARGDGRVPHGFRGRRDEGESP